MASSLLTPFEQAVCALILALRPEWKRPHWEMLSATIEKAMSRVVRGGFVEAQLPIELLIPDARRRFATVWTVAGRFDAVAEQQLRDFVRSRHGRLGFGIHVGPFITARLTAEGELAQREFRGDHDYYDADDPQPGLPLGIIQLVTGGPDGSGGLPSDGTARLTWHKELPWQSVDAPDPAARGAGPAAAGQPDLPHGNGSGSEKPLPVTLTPESFTPLADPLRSIEAAIREAFAARPPSSAGDASPAPRAAPRAAPVPAEPGEDDPWLSPGEQAEQLLGSALSDERDRVRRLQIAGAVRRKALRSGFLRNDDIDTSRPKNAGQFVRASAWRLPVAYYKAIRVAARDHDAARNAFPATDAGGSQEWYFCDACVRTFPARDEQGGCPDCGNTKLTPFVRSRPATPRDGA